MYGGGPGFSQQCFCVLLNIQPCGGGAGVRSVLKYGCPSYTRVVGRGTQKPDALLSRPEGSKTIFIMAFGTWFLKNEVSGPSGFCPCRGPEAARNNQHLWTGLS